MIVHFQATKLIHYATQVRWFLTYTKLQCLLRLWQCIYEYISNACYEISTTTWHPHSQSCIAAFDRISDFHFYMHLPAAFTMNWIFSFFFFVFANFSLRTFYTSYICRFVAAIIALFYTSTPPLAHECVVYGSLVASKHGWNFLWLRP